MTHLSWEPFKKKGEGGWKRGRLMWDNVFVYVGVDGEIWELVNLWCNEIDVLFLIRTNKI